LPAWVGWNIRITRYADGEPSIVRYFLAYEAARDKAIELIRKLAPVHEGESTEAVASVPVKHLSNEE